MKKVTACILFILLGLALCAPAVAHADSAQQKATKHAQKAYKKSVKQQKKAQKKALKSQKKATKNWKKHHSTGR